jgi:hypothetical protein
MENPARLCAMGIIVIAMIKVLCGSRAITVPNRQKFTPEK